MVQSTKLASKLTSIGSASATRTPLTPLSRSKRLADSLIVVAAVSAAAVGLIHLIFFPLGSMNADELVYQEMSSTFLRGLTKIPVEPSLENSSPPWLMQNIGGWSVPKYQPLFSAFLILAKPLGLCVPLASLAFTCTYSVGRLAEAVGSSKVRAAWLWTASGGFLMTASVALPYILSLQLGILMLLAATKLMQRGPLVVGAIFALALLCRPMDAVLFLITSVFIMRERKIVQDKSSLAKLGFILIFAGAPSLLWNLLQTGSFFDFPFTLTSRLDSWGFGNRKIYDADPGINFTFSNSLDSVTKNIWLVLTWTFGGLALLPMAYISFRRGYLRFRLSFMVLVLSWIIAYGGFWGAYTAVRFWNGTDYLGPFYWLPISLVLVLAIAATPKGVLNWRFLWLAAILLSSFVSASALGRNWVMTESWKNSDLMRIIKDPAAVIKLDKSYSAHVGAPIPLIANSDGEKKFFTEWSGILQIMKRTNIQKPRIWIAMAKDQATYDYLPRLAKVTASHEPETVEFQDTAGLVIQISDATSCYFKLISPASKFAIDFSQLSKYRSNAGTCNEKSEQGETVIKLLRADTGRVFHKIYSFYDQSTRSYYFATF